VQLWQKFRRIHRGSLCFNAAWFAQPDGEKNRHGEAHNGSMGGSHADGGGKRLTIWRRLVVFSYGVFERKINV
jgi:hypothetical protein